MDAHEKPTKPRLHRRVLGLLGLGATALVTLRPKRASAMTPPGNKGAARYAENEHVKQYYRVNRY